MLWQDLPSERDDAVSEDIVDLAFRLSGGTLAVEHAHALWRALLAELPWLSGEPCCGVHQIHAAASGNGWMRPAQDACEVLNLSRRTRLILRLPRGRLADAAELSGRGLDVGGHRLQLGKASERALVPSSTLYARYVICDGARHRNEERFIDWVAEALDAMGITATRVLCGMTSHIAVPGERLEARSLLVAALPPDASLQLQRRGLGGGRLMGCGLFVAHKGIEAVRDCDQELS